MRGLTFASLRGLISLVRRPRCERCLYLAAALLLLLAGRAGAQPGAHAPSAAAQSPAPWADPAPRFGAIAFTADGSFSSAWKVSSKEEAEAKVLADCIKFKRGRCEVVSVREELCAALVSAQIGKAHKITYAGAGLTPTIAQRTALGRCNGDSRTKGRCRLRTTLCGDGRQVPAEP